MYYHGFMVAALILGMIHNYICQTMNTPANLKFHDCYISRYIQFKMSVVVDIQ